MEGSDGDEAAVDDQVGAGGVGRGVRQQIDDRAGELVRVAHPLERDHFGPDLAPVLADVAGHLRVDVARADRVDPDAERGPLHGERLRQVHDAGLGGVVRGLPLRNVDDRGGHRRGVDDVAALALRDEVAGERLRDEEDAVQVDVHHGGEVRRCAVQRRLVQADARVVEQQVQCAHLGGRLLDGLRHPVRIGDVTLHRHGPYAVLGGDLRGDLAGVRHVEDHDVRPLCGEPVRHHLADALATTGHDRDLARQ
ncbi:hypothetical protein SDC9_120746 [bioreactor metagenome]|uniref:Uncharacterized protein n=1 Tax=bioreactor metagenome TaxID=1076179 RepID=A0A645CA11_9ZZZZ